MLIVTESYEVIMALVDSNVQLETKKMTNSTQSISKKKKLKKQKPKNAPN